LKNDKSAFRENADIGIFPKWQPIVFCSTYFKFFALLLLKFSLEWYKHHFKMILAPETISKIKIEFGSNKDAKGL